MVNLISTAINSQDQNIQEKVNKKSSDFVKKQKAKASRELLLN